jgi:hypothetical protein
MRKIMPSVLNHSVAAIFIYMITTFGVFGLKVIEWLHYL